MLFEYADFQNGRLSDTTRIYYLKRFMVLMNSISSRFVENDSFATINLQGCSNQLMVMLNAQRCYERLTIAGCVEILARDILTKRWNNQLAASTYRNDIASCIYGIWSMSDHASHCQYKISAVSDLDVITKNTLLNEVTDVVMPSMSEIERLYGLFLSIKTQKNQSSLNSTTKKSTSQLKMKSVPEAVLKKFIAKASKISHLNTRKLSVMFLEANCLIGLRPIEWFDMRFIQENNKIAYIQVKNAKFSNLRSNGEYRQIDIRHFTDDQKRLVISVAGHLRNKVYTLVIRLLNRLERKLDLSRSDIFKLDPTVDFQISEITSIHQIAHPTGRPNFGSYLFLFRSFNNQYNILSKDLPQHLADMIKDDQRITCYSARHQAIANAKSAGLTPLEVAAIFGHSSIKTAQLHHARAKAGWRLSVFQCAATQDSIDAVVTQQTIKVKKMPMMDEDSVYGRDHGFL
jgi:hypothetical protein